MAWWQILLGFLLMHFICGVILAFIFQPAHVIEETNFYKTTDEGSVENNWAIHQMHTTANFANNSKIFTWLIGGLNYQIEHHLFPNICHIHYGKISKIVKETAMEFNVPYHHHRTFFTALRSHFSLLHKLGTGSYDKALLKA
jgi:linoleoyl-CoA desaturase